MVAPLLLFFLFNNFPLNYYDKNTVCILWHVFGPSQNSIYPLLCLG